MLNRPPLSFPRALSSPYFPVTSTNLKGEDLPANQFDAWIDLSMKESSDIRVRMQEYGQCEMVMMERNRHCPSYRAQEFLTNLDVAKKRFTEDLLWEKRLGHAVLAIEFPASPCRKPLTAGEMRAKLHEYDEREKLILDSKAREPNCNMKALMKDSEVARDRFLDDMVADKYVNPSAKSGTTHQDTDPQSCESEPTDWYPGPVLSITESSEITAELCEYSQRQMVLIESKSCKPHRNMTELMKDCDAARERFTANLLAEKRLSHVAREQKEQELSAWKPKSWSYLSSRNKG